MNNKVENAKESVDYFHKRNDLKKSNNFDLILKKTRRNVSFAKKNLFWINEIDSIEDELCFDREYSIEMIEYNDKFLFELTDFK